MLLQPKHSINSSVCIYEGFLSRGRKKKKNSNKVYIVVMLWDILSSHAIFLCMLFHSKFLSLKKYLSHYFVPYPQLSSLLSAEALIFGFCSPMSTG
jgi:hypothetical protein